MSSGFSMHVPYQGSIYRSHSRPIRKLNDFRCIPTQPLIPGLEVLQERLMGLCLRAFRGAVAAAQLTPFIRKGQVSSAISTEASMRGQRDSGIASSSASLCFPEIQSQLQQGDAQRYSLERALQLAYAVGDRHQIRRLESDLEAFTGWRFQRQRIWLSR